MTTKSGKNPDVVEVTEITKFEKPELSGMLAQAEIDSQIATARKFPRDIAVFKNKLLTFATLDQETAAGCFYVLPRAGKSIEGPSIRLAEIALSCYRNCIAQGDVSHEDGRYIYAVGMTRDLENNVAVRVTVRRRITDREGKRFNDDMIAVTANAAVSIALRNAIFKIVPGAYIKPVLDACKLVAVGKAQTMNDAKTKALEYLAGLGVSEERVLATLNRRSIEDITKADILTLHGFCTAIRDNEAEIETIFPEVTSDKSHPSKGRGESKDTVAEEIKQPTQKQSAKKPAGKGRKTTNLF